jgi:6-phosphogluconolactonase
MKKSKILMAMVCSSVLFFSCKKDDGELQDQLTSDASKANGAKYQTVGFVYTLSNEVAGNKVLTYSRAATGMLSFVTGYPAGGTGTGTGLGSQGAVTLSDDNNILLAVNPGSNSVSSFVVSGKDLQLISTVPSGGVLPISVTVHKDLVYVLNAGGNGNVSGFMLHADGSLHPIDNSSRPLSSSAAGPAQVSFVQDGKVIVVTEKANNKIISYTIGMNGLAGSMHFLSSANPTPFGFAVGMDGKIYVSEAAGGASGASTVSSYLVAADGVITLADGPESAGQTAACWVVATNNGKYIYATNTGSNSVSSFRATNNGSLDILRAVAANYTVSTPIDAALSNNSKFLYVLNSGSESITAFTGSSDGRLEYLQNIAGLPDGAIGLAAK